MVEEKEPQPVDFEALLEFEKKRSEDYLTRLKYLQADFDNLNKRFDREAEQIKCYCTERLVVQLLDVVDELELAIKNGEISTSTETFLEGVEMTLKKFRKVLEQEGVSPIDNPEGKIFDAARHHAISTVERDDDAESTVVEEIRKGYLMKGKVIRPSIVKVAIKHKSNGNQTEEKK
jgi:molecular chaperone GrpE